jgi:hypothetical protein
VSLLLAVPSLRRRVGWAFAASWRGNRDRAIYEAVLANLIAALLLFAAGWLIAHFL